MKRTLVRRTLVNLSFAVALAALLPAAYGQGCSLAGAGGSYGFSDSGTVIGVGPRVASDTLTFDAAGNISGKVTASLNGSVTHTTLSGTYTVNPDCTGATTFGEYESGDLVLSGIVDFVWDDNMQEIRFIFISAELPDGTALALAINGEARKMDPPRGNSDRVALKENSRTQGS